MLGNKKINAAISSEDGVYYGDYIECTLLTGSTRTFDVIAVVDAVLGTDSSIDFFISQHKLFFPRRRPDNCVKASYGLRLPGLTEPVWLRKSHWSTRSRRCLNPPP